MQIDLKVKHQRILGVQQIPRLVVEKTTGFVFLNLEFDEEWDDCNITVLFTNDRRSGDPVKVIWRGDPIEVPQEVLVTGAMRISCVGLETDDYGKTVQRLSTKRMTEGIRIHAAGDQTGVEPGSVVPGLWEQVLAIMGPLQRLGTQDKSSIVGAVNEILGRSIQSIEQTVFSEEDGGINEFLITQYDGTKTVLQTRNGRKGDPGPQGERGEPFKFEDFTPEQLECLRGPQGLQGETGEAFEFEDFTPEQLESLRGPKGESGITAPVNGFFTLAVDGNGDLWVYYEDDAGLEFEYDSETGALYIVQEVQEEV